MLELLELLEKDPVLTAVQLAAMLGKSEAEISALISRLEAEKVIVGYRTVVNWEKACSDRVTAFIEVKITPQREVGFDCLAERIYRFPEVRNLYLMSGAYDLMVMVEGNNLKDISRFVSNKLSTIDGIISTATHFMLKTYKESGVIFEDKEEDRRLAVSP